MTIDARPPHLYLAVIVAQSLEPVPGRLGDLRIDYPGWRWERRAHGHALLGGGAAGDGVRGPALAALEAHAATRRRELEACLDHAGLSNVDIRRELPVFRSRDLLRTGGGAPGDTRVFVRALDPGDRTWLEEEHDARVPDLIAGTDLAALARASLPADDCHAGARRGGWAPGPARVGGGWHRRWA